MSYRPAYVPEDRFVQAGRLLLHCLEWEGNGRGPDIVLLHGIGDNARVWDRFALEISAKGRRVIALDQRGHGLSDWADPSQYRCGDYVSDLDAVVRSLGLTRFVLMGHSMGALHATRYAALRPDLVAGLVHADIEPCPPAWNKKYLLNLYSGLPPDYGSIDEYVGELKKNCPFADEGLLYEVAASALVQGEDGKFRVQFDREVLFHFDPSYDMTPFLPEIRCPALVIRGRESRVMSEQGAVRMSGAISGGRFAQVPKAAHPLHLDNPAGFRQEVFTFLAEAGLL